MEINLQANVTEGKNQEVTGYQDIAEVVIHDDRFINTRGMLDVAFIMLEAMESSQKFDGREPGGWVEHYNRLIDNINASPSARYAILTNGSNTTIYRRDLKFP